MRRDVDDDGIEELVVGAPSLGSGGGAYVETHAPSRSVE
jgi:hypothetical protein